MATVVVRIEQERWKATTPHVPDMAADADSEADAVNALIYRIRDYVARHQQNGSAVPWISDADVRYDGDSIIRDISGIEPRFKYEISDQKEKTDVSD